MSRTKSTENEGTMDTNVVSSSLSPYRIKHIVRGISKNPASDSGADPIWKVEEYIHSFLEAGYRLAKTHVIESTPEYIYVMYILVQD